MKMVWMFGLSAMLAVASSAASAFDEQRGGTPAPGAAPTAPLDKAPAQPKIETTPDLNLETGTSANKQNEGTVVRIPGLGKLGVLPKMDFGLELLYGATNDKPSANPQQQQESDPNDITIRGSLKHKF